MKGNSFLKSIKIFAILVLAGLSASYAFAQTRSISGTVVDSQNVPVIGASVIVVGNNTMGTVTDLDGKFTLNVPAGSSISVSFIGYETQVVAVGNQSVFNIVLAEDTEFLEETVVIGYGVQKKSDLTGPSGKGSRRTDRKRIRCSWRKLRNPDPRLLFQLIHFSFDDRGRTQGKQHQLP